MAIVFAVAILARVVFNLSLEHRLCHFGDAFFFLTSGAQLLIAIKTGVLLHLSDLHAPASLGLQAMQSVSFADRLLIDGPVYPAYLAIIQCVIGLDPATSLFDAHTIQLSISNSLLDACACLLIYQMGRLAFDRTTGFIAGLMAAVYPAAILNTASCYSEPFSYFLIALWLPLLLTCSLRHIGKVAQLSACLATGVCTGLVILAKPIFIALPPMVALVIFSSWLLAWERRRPAGLGGRLTSRPYNQREFIRRIRKAVPCLVLVIVGALITVAPWVYFTGVVTGKPTLIVNRYPAFNLAMGNRLDSDGWRQYPMPPMSGNIKDVLKDIQNDFAGAPADYAAMQIRKASRLWAGSWNNFATTFVLSPEEQDCVQQWLLLSGLCGLLFALSKFSLSTRQGKSAIVLAVVALLHCIYIAFEPQSRYAYSAMPCVITLAAFAISFLFRSDTKLRLRTAVVLIAGLAFIVFKRFSPSIISLIHPLVTNQSVLFIDAALWIVAWSAVVLMIYRCTQGLAARTTLAAFWLAISANLLCSSLYSENRYEAKLTISEAKPANQSINIADGDQQPKYLLVDVSSNSMSPAVVALINGRELAPPLPWWQVSANNQELISALSVQAHGMGRSIQSFRQWWVFSIPQDALKAGSNEVSICKRPGFAGDVTLFADYPLAYSGGPVGAAPCAARMAHGATPTTKASGTLARSDAASRPYSGSSKAWLPSLDGASWTKAFSSVFRNEPRIYSQMDVTPERAAAALKQTDPVPRVFIVDTAPNKNAVGNPEALTLTKDTVAVDGSYPPSFFLTPMSAMTLPQHLPPASRFRLCADVQAPKQPTNAFASVSFTASPHGKPIQWTSPWQPTSSRVTKTWSPWDFGDQIPADILDSPDAKVTVTVSPFAADLLFLNKKQALKRSISMKNVRLEFSPGNSYPSPVANPILR